MKVELAGVNVPTKVLDQVLNELPEEKREHFKERLTPIILAAAYARISRSEKSVSELVDEAMEDVPKAKKSAQEIAFGMSHQSIADHASFNFNIEGVSRLVIEDIEARRIAGYTEKSQRYVTLDGDYVKPKEFSPEDLAKFEKLVALQNNFYFKNREKLVEHLKTRFPTIPSRDLEGKAKEDARYSLSLATQAQLGCTYGGQTAEHAIRLSKYSDLEETKEFGRKLAEAVKDYEEVVQLIDPETFKKFNQGRELQDDSLRYTRGDMREAVRKVFRGYEEETLTPVEFISGLKHRGVNSKNHGVDLFVSNNPDLNIIASILFSNSKKNFGTCYSIAHFILKDGRGEEFMKECLKHIGPHDKVPREFEAGNLIYSADISSSCFAQLKRHRMTSLLKQDYNPQLGCVIPESIREIGAEEELKEVCKKSSHLYHEFLDRYGKAAEYCLTNAHKRRVLLPLNMRELYHISRVREDIHAQWEIRELTGKMSELARNIAPVSTMLLAGKHEFNDTRKRVYGKN